MPELPEVETVRRTLTELVVGKTIQSVSVGWPKMIKHPDDVVVFGDLLEGQTVNEIGRVGKFLIFYLDNYALVSHLRMEGKYAVGEGEPSKHTHVRFFFTDGTELWYQDVRKFGTMHLFPIGTELTQAPLNKLGPEPMDETFTSAYLYARFQKTVRTIKAVLLDQAAIAGLGNIYVDEALFRSGLHPVRPASSLSEVEVNNLQEHIKATLQDAIRSGGSSIRSYVNGNGEMGYFQQQLYVYGRKGESCKVCNLPIEKTVVAGRGTHFCPHCQT